MKKEKTQSIFKVERINRLDTSSGVAVAIVDVSVADTLLVKGLRIIKGKDGLFVSMPQDQSLDGKWYPVVYPLTKTILKELERVVLEAYGEGE